MKGRRKGHGMEEDEVKDEGKIIRGRVLVVSGREGGNVGRSV